MSGQNKSYKQILKSTSILGSAAAINIVISLLRMKVLAVLLGPAGVGFVGLLQSLMAMVSNVAAMGTGTIGIRQIAEAASEDDLEELSNVRRLLFWGISILAIIAGVFVWSFSHIIAEKLLADSSKADWVRWLAIGIALSVASQSQNALLNGLRKIKELAKLRIYSALIATVTGIVAVYFYGEDGLLFFVISVPLATFAFGLYYVNGLSKIVAPPTAIRELIKQWNKLLKLGFSFMLAGLAVTLGQFAVRTLVQNKLGPEALGLFQASWAISMTYIGFVLGAMSGDYYPRLTGIINDNKAVNKLVNEQTQIVLLLSAPILLAMVAFTPWILELLYSSEFIASASTLRWQILGDALKILSWPLGFIILAAGFGKTFMIYECVAMGLFVLFTWLGIDELGVEATGIGFFLMYVIYLPMVYLFASYHTGFKWTHQNIRDGLLLFSIALTLVVISEYDQYIGLIIGFFTIIIYSAISFLRLSEIMDFKHPISNKLITIFNRISKNAKNS